MVLAAVLTRAFIIFLLPMTLCRPLLAGSLDIQKLRVKGAQHSKDLRYFLDTGLVAGRQTAIEQQIENFERSLAVYKEAKPGDRNAALRQVQAIYEKFHDEFKAIADALRALVDQHQAVYKERSNEPFADTPTREKALATIEVGKQEEARALAAYNNRNYSFSAHLYLRSLRHYAAAFAHRGWPPLVALPQKQAKKAKSAKSATAP